MKPIGIYDIIKIDEYSATPKYQQIINSILKAVESGRLVQQDILPSINDLGYELEVSRDTAEKGYRYLKQIGVIGSVPGKGYFIKSTVIDHVFNICLMFNKLSVHKKIIYDSFVGALGSNAAIDFYIYNNDFSLFKKLLNNRREDYTHFVIIPHFIEGGENVYEIINMLPKEKLILLDKKIPGVDGEYGAVYENFSKDIYQALQKAIERLKNYHTIKVLFPRNSYYPKEIIDGFSRFCQDYAFNYKIISDFFENEIRKGEVYITVMEDDLVRLIEKTINEGYEIGKDIGIISYNETPVKKILLKGITTISTDFEQMGKLAAKLVLDGSRQHIEIPFMLTLRDSL